MSAAALIVVDVQNDFCEGGALPVSGGTQAAEDIATFINGIWNLEEWWGDETYRLIVASRDFHDQYSDNGGHFSDNPDFKNTWPRHCVIGTKGAELHPAVARIRFDRLFSKGYKAPAYSAFQGVGCNEYLDTYLKRHGITHVDVVGIAGDYCVRQTALDAVRLGYKTSVLPGLIASVGGRKATYDTYDEIARVQR